MTERSSKFVRDNMGFCRLSEVLNDCIKYEDDTP